jgi:hypothetical protein
MRHVVASGKEGAQGSPRATWPPPNQHHGSQTNQQPARPNRPGASDGQFYKQHQHVSQPILRRKRMVVGGR